MPFYNVSPYFREAIESVLHQTYSNWELLLADDGSSDGSTAIALEYEQAFPEKIYYLKHPENKHLGTMATRHLAIDHSRGDYLAFLDADDYWLPEKLAYQVSVAQQYAEATMICGATKYWYSWADPQKKDVIIPVGAPQDALIYPPTAALTLYPLVQGAAPCLCSLMLTRKAALQYLEPDNYFTGKYQLYEDQVFLIKMYLNEPVYISSGVMDYYRQRADSNMHKLKSEGHYREVRYFFLQWLRKYLNQKGINDRAVRRKLREAFMPYTNPLFYKLKLLIKKVINFVFS